MRAPQYTGSISGDLMIRRLALALLAAAFMFSSPASHAAKAGLAVGDMIVEIEGIAVAGAKADALKAAVQKSVGESLRLKIKRGTDASQDVSLIAGPQPPKLTV